MRASEFVLDEGKASRRKQASMNAKRRMANAQPTTAPAVEPTASTGTSAPAVAPTIDNPVNPNVKPGGSKEAQAYQAQRTAAAQPEAEPATDPAYPDYADTPAVARMKSRLGMGQDAAPTKPPASSSIMNTLKSAGKGIADKFSTQGKISARTDQIFMDKFLKDLGTAEQTSTGLRGQPFDVKTWVGKYLAQNKWDAGDQQAPLDKAIAANYKPGIAKAMAAIGKYNNMGSTVDAKAVPAQATAADTTTAQPAVQVSLGGKPGQANTLDPADPVDAKILSMLKQQGKI